MQHFQTTKGGYPDVEDKEICSQKFAKKSPHTLKQHLKFSWEKINLIYPKQHLKFTCDKMQHGRYYGSHLALFQSSDIDLDEQEEGSQETQESNDPDGRIISERRIGPVVYRPTVEQQLVGECGKEKGKCANVWQFHFCFLKILFELFIFLFFFCAENLCETNEYKCMWGRFMGFLGSAVLLSSPRRKDYRL